MRAIRRIESEVVDPARGRLAGASGHRCLGIELVVRSPDGTGRTRRVVFACTGYPTIPHHQPSTAARWHLDNRASIIDFRTFSSDNTSTIFVTGNEFIRRVKTLGRARGVVVALDASRGKGSHQTLYFGRTFTVVRNPKDELKTGTFHAMCSQLGIKSMDL